MNAACVMMAPKFDYNMPAMIELHWLPLKNLIIHIIPLLTFNCLTGEATHLQFKIR